MATMVVTGASAGLGASAAVELTQRGHEVHAVGRSATKLAAVHERMKQAAPAGAEVPAPIAADFASLDEVRQLADTVLERCPTLDVLANNAGLQTSRRERSADGFEMAFAVNHLAPFLLTNLLADRVGTSGGRVVTTASEAYRFGRFDVEDPQKEEGRWSMMGSYGRSKMANILFTAELGRRTDLPATCFHPGAVNTDLGRGTRLSSLFKPVMGVLARTPEKGGETLVWLATDPEGAAPTAVYYQDRKPKKLKGGALDRDAAARLWDYSAKLVSL
jgi:NAD(P)-dependent dehydrogenase (short-subunit alcohol dehydrogenase family)